MNRTKNTKKKINVDGKDVKVDLSVYKVLENLSEALKAHEIALLTWVHKVYNEKDKADHSPEESALFQYCMMIPDALNILKRMNDIDEENRKEGSDDSSDKIGATADNGSVD